MAISLEKILFATDFSPPAQQARQYAVALAEQFHARLHVVHAVDDTVFVPASEVSARWLQEEVERVRGLLSVDFASIPNHQVVVLQGNAVQVIVDYARDALIDLIVLGTHGRTGLSHVLLGSNAEKVVRLATCPVLTVHPTNHTFAMSSR